MEGGRVEEVRRERSGDSRGGKEKRGQKGRKEVE